jgi:hypothetical protein
VFRGEIDEVAMTGLERAQVVVQTPGSEALSEVMLHSEPEMAEAGDDYEGV